MNSQTGDNRPKSALFTILFEVDTLDRGGLENVVHQLATRLDPKLFRTVVVCTTSGGRVAKQLERENIPVEILGDKKDEAFLILLDRYDVDLVFSHHSFLGAPLAHRMNIPVLSVLHNMYFWFQPDVLSVIREQDPFVNRYVAVSGRVRDFVAGRFKIGRDRIAVIPNGIDAGRLKDFAASGDRMTRRDWDLDENDLVFLNVAAINPVKNQNLILEAVREVRDDHPEFKVLVVGKTLNEKYGDFIREKAERFNLEKNVRFIEFTDRIYDLYNLADVFLLPSFIEGWSLAAMEAHCFDLPMVLTDVGSAGDLAEAGARIAPVELFPEGMDEIGNDDILYLAEHARPDQVEALSRAMREIATQAPALRSGRILDPSRAEGFSIEAMIDAYEREMIRVIAEASKKARKEGGADVRARLEHVFRELRDQRETVVQSKESVERSYERLQQSNMEDREIVQRLAAEQNQALEQVKADHQARLQELNARINYLQSTLEMHQAQFKLTNQQLSNILYSTQVVLNRLSIKERIKALRRAISSRLGLKHRLRSRKSRTLPPQASVTAPSSSAIEEEKTDEKVNGVQRYAILCFPIIDWEFRFQRPQQLLSRFADAGHPVYYGRAQMEIGLERYTTRPLRDNVVELDLSAPRNIIIYNDRLDEKTTSFLVESVEQLVRDHDLQEVVIVVQFPFWQPLVSRLAEKYGWKVVYDCMDEHSGFGNVGGLFVNEEETLLKESHRVVVSSNKLLEKARRFNDNVCLIPNAAEFDRFADPKPNKKVKLDGPIIGYFGAMAEWFDYDAILQAADLHPDWNFLLIGGHHSHEIDQLKQQPNITLTGEVPYKDLPGYLAHFDVCLIPMRLSPLIEATNPVKFFEYLCTGKPVVTADLPELRSYDGLYYRYHDPREFVKQVETALGEHDPDLARKRIETGRENQWDNRFEDLAAEINSLYPLVSVMIPSYNNLDYLRMNLEGLRHNSLYPNLEVIVVDNASGPETVSFLKEQEQNWRRLTVLFNEKNVGFARANNQAAEKARGEYLVLLNDDVVVTKGWLTKLLRYCQNPAVGMVGPVTNSCGNEACIKVPYEDIADMENFARDYTRKNRGKFFEINVLAFFCTVIPRRVWDAVGPLDEQYEIGMFEDDDYALRIKEHGFKMICAQDVFVHHFGRASFARLKESEYRKIFGRNKERFEKKWGRPWVPHKYL